MSTTGGGKKVAISLYRSLLRTHARYLPPEMRQLGDAYVKSEFRAHQTASDPDQLRQFFTQWTEYRDYLVETTSRRMEGTPAVIVVEQQTGGATNGFSIAATPSSSARRIGRDLPSDVELSEEQEVNLRKLREEAVKAGKGGE